MSLKFWLMFLVPAVGSLLGTLATITGNNLVIVAICALAVGLAGIIPQLPDNFSFGGRTDGKTRTPSSSLRDIGMGFTTGCLSFIITFFLPLMIFSRAAMDGIYDAGIRPDDFLHNRVVTQVFHTALLGAIPLNLLIGATIIANANRPWLASLVAGVGFIVASTGISVIGAEESRANVAANPLGMLAMMTGLALLLALIYIAGTFVRNLIIRRNVKTEPESHSQPNPS
jgi:hypothetical protein